MIIGITGSHRCGKTTLAKKFASSMSTATLPLPSFASELMRELDLDPKTPMAFSDRLDFQSRLLIKHIEQWSEARESPNVYVTDRTPLDFLAYAMTDLKHGELEELSDGMLAGYYKACMAATAMYFNGIVMLRPNIPLIDAEGRGSALPMEVARTSSMIEALLCSELSRISPCTPYMVMDDDIVDLDDRRDAMLKFFIETVKPLANQAA